ncbi:MAG: hypothetical protein K0R57_395 [Paenibacillaceae bacterium]|jgi:hypothetical protein|nr:hypothetical protein [Paenibacillaceae bacterium]
MNCDCVNNRVSQLPIAMAGIVHVFGLNGRGLSNYGHTVISHAKIHLP